MECFSYLRNILDLLSDGKTPYERRLGNHSKDRSFRLVHWLSITLFLRKTSQESINLERKSYLDEVETMDTSEIYSKRLNAKEVIFPKEMENLFFQPQMDESNFLEEIRN